MAHSAIGCYEKIDLFFSGKIIYHIMNYTIMLFVATDLPHIDTFSKTDAFAVLFIRGSIQLLIIFYNINIIVTIIGFNIINNRTQG